MRMNIIMHRICDRAVLFTVIIYMIFITIIIDASMINVNLNIKFCCFIFFNVFPQLSYFKFMFTIFVYYFKTLWFVVMGIKGRRVHMIEELSETIISFQRGKPCLHCIS